MGGYMSWQQAEANSPYASGVDSQQSASEAEARAGAAVGFRGSYGGEEGQAAQDFQRLQEDRARRDQANSSPSGNPYRVGSQAWYGYEIAYRDAQARSNTTATTQPKPAPRDYFVRSDIFAVSDPAQRSLMGKGLTAGQAAEQLRFESAQKGDYAGERKYETLRLQAWTTATGESAAYHTAARDSGLPQAPNPYEYAADLFTYAEKGYPQKRSEAFSPVDPRVLNLPGGQGGQAYIWKPDSGRNYDLRPAMDVVAKAQREGQMGVYGNAQSVSSKYGILSLGEQQAVGRYVNENPFQQAAGFRTNDAAMKQFTPEVMAKNQGAFVSSLFPTAKSQDSLGTFGGMQITSISPAPKGVGVLSSYNPAFAGREPDSTTTISGSNQTIRDKRAWLQATEPRLTQMDADITSLAKGNTSGVNWVGSYQGYKEISGKISEYNTLNKAFKTNVTSYNAMDAENPTIITQTIPGNLTAQQGTQKKDIFQDAMGYLGKMGVPQENPHLGATKADTDAAAWVQGKLKGLGLFGGAGTVVVGSTAYGYGSTTTLGTPALMTTLESNPVGWGALAGGLAVIGMESSGRLGLFGDTKEYSVRTAGRDFSTWLNAQNKNGIGTGFPYRDSPKTMSAGTGMYRGSEVPSQTKTWSELSPYIPTYNEAGTGMWRGNEAGTGMYRGSELFSQKTPLETISRNNYDYNYRNKNANVNEFIDAFGVSYPTPTKNPIANPNANPFATPFVNPLEYPNKEQTGYNLDNPIKNNYGNPFNPVDAYRYEQGYPKDPGKPDWKFPELILPSLPSFGGGMVGGDRRGRRGVRSTQIFAPDFGQVSMPLFRTAHTGRSKAASRPIATFSMPKLGPVKTLSMGGRSSGRSVMSMSSPKPTKMMSMNFGQMTSSLFGSAYAGRKAAARRPSTAKRTQVKKRKR